MAKVNYFLGPDLHNTTTTATTATTTTKTYPTRCSQLDKSYGAIVLYETCGQFRRKSDLNIIHNNGV